MIGVKPVGGHIIDDAGQLIGYIIGTNNPVDMDRMIFGQIALEGDCCDARIPVAVGLLAPIVIPTARTGIVDLLLA